jgi:hypothetical protein
MLTPSSPCSECSTLAPAEYEADPNVVKLLVRILTARHGILQYHGQTGELSTYPWLIQYLHASKTLHSLSNPPYRPTNRRGDKIYPSQFATYRETHVFRYPCCLCATGDTYVEASVFQRRHGISQGDYVAECATSNCGYMCKFAAQSSMVNS